MLSFQETLNGGCQLANSSPIPQLAPVIKALGIAFSVMAQSRLTMPKS
jgi:hypothetical protein